MVPKDMVILPRCFSHLRSINSLLQLFNHCKQYLGEFFGLIVESTKRIFFNDRFIFQNIQDSYTFKNGSS